MAGPRCWRGPWHEELAEPCGGWCGGGEVQENIVFSGLREEDRHLGALVTRGAAGGWVAGRPGLS